MTVLRARAPASALRSFRAAAIVPIGSSARCYSTNLEPEKHKGNEAKLGRTFQGQVMGSIGQRMKREREEWERYEQWRHVKDPARNWSITWGLFLPIPDEIFP